MRAIFLPCRPRPIARLQPPPRRRLAIVAVPFDPPRSWLCESPRPLSPKHPPAAPALTWLDPRPRAPASPLIVRAPLRFFATLACSSAWPCAITASFFPRLAITANQETPTRHATRTAAHTTMILWRRRCLANCCLAASSAVASRLVSRLSFATSASTSWISSIRTNPPRSSRRRMRRSTRL